MAHTRKLGAALAVLVAAGVLAGAAQSQDTPAVVKSATTKPIAKINQPPGFLALAAKAAKVDMAYAKGVATTRYEGEIDPDRAAPIKPVAFEVWVKGAKCRMKTPAPVLEDAAPPKPPAPALKDPVRPKAPAPLFEDRVGDGKYRYLYKWGADGRTMGSRKRVTKENLYAVLSYGAPIFDATQGYANIMAAVKFIPIKGETKLPKGLGKLRWYRLKAVTRPPHLLVLGEIRVTMGLDPKTGLVRALVGRRMKDEMVIVESVVFPEIRTKGVTDDDLKLPADAARVKWRNADRDGEKLETPKLVIRAPKKPAKGK